MLFQFFYEAMLDVFIGLNKRLQPSGDTDRLIWGSFWEGAVESAVTYLTVFLYYKKLGYYKMLFFLRKMFFLNPFQNLFVVPSFLTEGQKFSQHYGFCGCTRYDHGGCPFVCWCQDWRRLHFYWGELVKMCIDHAPLQQVIHTSRRCLIWWSYSKLTD